MQSFRVNHAGRAVGGAVALRAAFRLAGRVAAVVVSSPALSIAPDRHPAIPARVERIVREG